MVGSAKKAFNALSSGIKSGFEKVKNAAKKAFGAINNDAKKTNGLLATMRSRMQGLALSLLIFNQISKTFNAMVSGAKEGISEFAKYSKDCNAVLSEFKSTLQTMKYNLGAAFAPIIQVVVPYLTMLINALNSAISKISQFFAVLTGNSTYQRAIKQQVDFAGSLKDTANAAKEASGALAGFDKLNVVKQQDTSGSSGGGGSSSGAEFEEVPVENGIKELAEKVKEILAKLFAPLKEAWEREGQFVIDSWKSALNEIWLLVKDIGRDFLIMWNEEETIKIFEDLLHIIGDIGLVVANLASNFREAWNENQNGLHIFEGIRDIIGVIVENIREAADETVKWAENLDFAPLMGKISDWIHSLKPLVDSLSGVLADFYTQVLLPLSKWALEKGLPDLLQVFIDFNNAVDWESLRKRLSEFWEHLEPFAETVGEGLIIFIGDLSQAIADFTKSETFEKVLNWLEETMDSTTPDDIANGIKKITKALIFFKTCTLALSAIAPAVSTIKSLMDIFKVGKGTAVAAEMTTVSRAASLLYSSLAALSTIGIITATIVVGIKFSEDYKEWKANIEKYGWDEGRKKTADDNKANPYNKESNYSKNIDEWNQKFSAFKESLIEFATFNFWTDSEMGKGFGEWWNNDVAPWFTKEKWSGLWNNVKEACSTKWNEILLWWKETAIYKWWNEDVKTWFTEEKWKELWNSVKKAFTDKWNEIKNWWKNSAVSKWWNEDVKPWFTKEKWLGVLQGVKDAFESIWGKIKESVSGVFDEILEDINGITKAISGIKVPALSGAVGAGIGAATKSSNIPHLATGSVIRGGNPFVALLGDQPAGQTNVEAPLSTIKQALKEALRENGGGGGEYTFIAQLNGKTLYKETVRQDQMFKKSTGKSSLGN